MKNFVVYKSSAGSGKTTTLAIEYLKLSLYKPEHFKHILALTFTKDAANEMKQRILDYLILIIDYQEGDQLDFIFNPIIKSKREWIGIENSQGRSEVIKQIQLNANALLQYILHAYSDFAISTIDSFTHRIIKSFAHDLGIAISFDVELDAENIVKTAVNELISKVGETNPQLTNVLLDFAMHKIGNDQTRKIDTDLRLLAKNLLDDVKEEHLIGLRALSMEDLLKLKDQIIAEINTFKSFVKKQAQKAEKLIADQGLTCMDFPYGTGNICNWFGYLAENKLDEKKIKPKDRVLKSIYEDKWYNGKAGATEKAAIDSIKDELIVQFHLLDEFIESNIDNYLIYIQLAKHIYPLVVLMEIEKLVFQLKSESNILHISDFNKLIAKAIHNEPAPFIYERIGNWYWHFLLDEFQDTSALQWNNLLPLIENSLSENHLSLLVGDSKQSIYRWRGSDVNQLSQLPDLVHHNDDLSKERELLLKENYFEQQLLANYRSDGAIVDFNNSLFHFIHQSGWLPSTYKKVYAEVEQSVADEKKDFGLVDLILLDAAEEELLNKSLLDSLNTALKEGYKYEDITILVRKNSQATAFADLLIENQIPVISSVALRISSSSKVQFLLSLFRMIEQPKEKLFKIEMIRYLLQSKKIAQFRIEDLSSIILSFSVDEKGFNNDFFHWLSGHAYSIDFNQINKGDVYELAEYFIRLFDLREPDPYVQFFLDRLHEFKRNPFNQLKDFMDWWLEHETNLFIEMPGGLNAVTIQTVFKAKGLQYPVVIFPIPDKSLKTDLGKNRSWINPNIAELEQLKSFPFALHSLKDTLLESAYQQEVEAQMLDDINLFYVALTRAKNRMFLLADKVSTNSKEMGDNFVPSKMLAEFLEAKEVNPIQDNTYRFGTQRKLPKSIEKDETKFYYLQKYQGQDWRMHLDLANTQNIEDESSYAKQIWGIYLHEILANIESADDAEKTISRASYAGLLSADDKVQVFHIIEQLLNHPLLSEYYKAGLHVANETDLVDEAGKLHRPDRLVFFQNKTIVIDYKTGKINENHKKQIQEYADLLALMKYPNPECYLVYLDQNIEVVQI